MSDDRLPANWFFVGANGTRKTTNIKKAIMKPLGVVGGQKVVRNLILPANRDDKAWHGIPELKPAVTRRWNDLKGKYERVYFIPGINNYTGNRVVFIDRPEIFDAVIHPDHGFKNGGLVLDDFKNYVPSQGLVKEELRKLLGGRRHRMVDLFWAAWTFQDVNAELLGFQARVFVFYITRPPNQSVKQKFPDFDRLYATWRRVYDANKNLPEDQRLYAEPLDLA